MRGMSWVGGLDEVAAFAQHRNVIHRCLAANPIRYDVIVVVVACPQWPSAFLATTSTSL